MRNDDPSMPWNDPSEKYDPTKPWNDTCYKNDPCAPWNDCSADERDYKKYCEEHHISER